MRGTLLRLTVIAPALCLALAAFPDFPAGAVVTSSEIAGVDQKLQRLAEREAALKAKEEAFNRLSAQLQLKVKELEAAKQGLEAMIAARKNQDNERFIKMVKIYKSLKAPDAAELLNKLEPKLAIAMLDQMDQKTVVKLVPFITQPRVLDWTRQNLAGK